MRLQGTFLRSRVARQILALFLFCAFLPTVALSVGVFVWQQRSEAARLDDALRRESKQIGMNLFERLAMLQQQLGLYGRALGQGCTGTGKARICPAARQARGPGERTRDAAPLPHGIWPALVGPTAIRTENRKGGREGTPSARSVCP